MHSKSKLWISQIVPTNKSPEASKDEGFENMTLDTSIPYCHHNYKGHQPTNQKQNKYTRLSKDPTLLKRSSSMKSCLHYS